MCVLHVEAAAITYGNGRLDDHYCIRICLQHQVDNLFYMCCVEIVLYRVVVGRSCYNHIIGISIRSLAVKSGYQSSLTFLL